MILTKPQFYKIPVTIIVIYRSPSISISIFFNRVARVLNQKQIHILIGDFDDDALDHKANQRLWRFSESYELIVSRPTHLDGGLLDHVYFSKSFMCGKKVA